MEKQVYRKRKSHLRVGVRVGDKISFINVDLEVPFKSLKR